eukprot:6463761-Amphidinium_carterae.1
MHCCGVPSLSRGSNAHICYTDSSSCLRGCQEEFIIGQDLEVWGDPSMCVEPPNIRLGRPALQPAVFPPTLREPPPPALDLFDLEHPY